MKRMKASFETEAALCLAFLGHLPDGWTAYPETGGFDILLVAPDQYQIGIEAKLTLNAKVISQITEDYWDATRAGPDYRAILVPYGTTDSLGAICALLGLTVLTMHSEESKAAAWTREWFSPTLPTAEGHSWGRHRWHDLCPTKRVKLPDYVPDVGAGHSAPVKLTAWKVKAIKIAVLLERRGFVTRQDFRDLQIDHRRWIIPGMRWLNLTERRGVYERGEHFPDFRGQHPVNYEEIAADFEKWAPKAVELPMVQAQML